MNRESTVAAEAEPTASLEASAAQAFDTAAARLGVSAEGLAKKCQSGALADVIIELRLARFNLPEADQERVESLLRDIGVLP